jgi:hypothetical protein
MLKTEIIKNPSTLVILMQAKGPTSQSSSSITVITTPSARNDV